VVVGYDRVVALPEGFAWNMCACVHAGTCLLACSAVRVLVCHACRLSGAVVVLSWKDLCGTSTWSSESTSAAQWVVEMGSVASMWCVSSCLFSVASHDINKTQG
jgi:hypothetical protein